MNRTVRPADRPDLPLFAYGSLRRGGGADQWLLREAEWLGPATVTGRLWHDGRYPALVLDRSGIPIQGDLWQVPGARWPDLDAWEGCSNDEPQPHPYRRITLTVDTARVPRRAQAYLWNGPLDHLTPLDGGDWLQYASGANLPHR